jgi:hypothetical protein
MPDDIDRIAAPALPKAEGEYKLLSQEHMTNILRIFFNRLVDTANSLISRNSVAFHSDIPGEIEELDNKPVPANADVLLIEDSEDSWAKKEIKIGDLMSDFYLEVAKGNVVGHSSINKFGENFLVTADTEEDIWDGGGDYTYPTTADCTHIHQSVDQVALRGGAVEVQGLDINWALVTQTALLDATLTSTLVALTTPLLRVFRMKVQEDVVANSDIHLTNAGDTIEYAYMLAGNNQTLMALFTVPAGKTAYMTKYYASLTLTVAKDALGCNIRLWAAHRALSHEFQLKHSIGIQAGAAGVEHMFMPYQSFAEKTDIRISGTPNANDGQISAGFDLIVVDN